MAIQLPLLTILIWLPFLGAVLVLMTGSDQRAHYARAIAVATTVVTMLLSVPLYLGFDPSSYEMQFREDVLWISAYQIRYALGVDGISILMVILTNFTSLLVVLAGTQAIKKRVAQYMATFLMLQGMIIGVFCALDSILFYVFWEGMLIPMYLSIGIWGSANRSYASIKFFLFTFSGSLVMLIAFLYLYTKSGSFLISSFYGLPLPLSEQKWLFWALFLSFAVKVPMWPIHTWLPDAHTEAPAGGSVVLAALMLKLGVYGFLRFSLPIVPLACYEFSGVMIVLSLIAIVYIGLIAIVQKDMKKLIAYSSIAHMGFATLGCFMIYAIVRNTHGLQEAYMSLEGAMVHMIAHAFGSGAMFLGVGLLADRFHTHSRLIKDYGGVAHVMPVFAAFYLLFCMSNVGLPGTAGFVGEFMIIMSAYQSHFLIALFAALTLILSACYTLWMYKRVFFGPVQNIHVESFQDINYVEKINFTLLAIGVFAVGLYPQPLIHILQASIGHLLLQSIPIEFVMQGTTLSV